MKKMILLMMLISSGYAYAEDVCFTPQEANSIFRELSDRKVLEEENKELQTANDLLKQNIGLEVRKNSVLQERISLQEQVITNSERLMKEQVTTCEKMVDEAKPTFWDTLKNTGVGVIVGAVLILLL